MAGDHREPVRRGTLLYEGTYLSDTLQTAVLKQALEEAGLAGPDQQEPAAVHVTHGVNRMGKRVHYYFNYSGGDVKAIIPTAQGQTCWMQAGVKGGCAALWDRGTWRLWRRNRMAPEAAVEGRNDAELRNKASANARA